MYVFDKTFILVFKFIQYPCQKSLLVRSLWDLTFLRAFCSPGRTCLFCLPCGQGCCPRLDKKSCDWLLISLLMIELIPSHSLFCLARTIKLFLTVLKILLKSRHPKSLVLGIGTLGLGTHWDLHLGLALGTWAWQKPSKVSGPHRIYSYKL